MKKKLDQGGAALWIFVILVIVGGWTAFKVGRLYFDNGSIKSEIEAIAANSLVQRNVDVKAESSKILAVYGVDIVPDDVKVDFSDQRDQVTIAFSYSRPANFLIFNPKVPFEISVQKKTVKAVGVIQDVQDSIESSNAASANRYQQAVKNATQGQQREVETEP